MPAVKSHVGHAVRVTEPDGRQFRGIIIAEFRGLRRGSNVITRVQVTSPGTSGRKIGSQPDVDTRTLAYL